MNASEVLRRITAALDRSGISYMLTGSFVSAHHGASRSTLDIDIVIAPTAEQLHRLVKLLPTEEYYVEVEAAIDALQRESLFNVIDLATGWKID